jgi:4-amino-4-deoxy-L-arabinose transferase-like glycosyltransferase
MSTFRKFIHSYAIVAILLLGFLLRLALASTSLDLDIRADEREYTNIAKDIVRDPLGYQGTFRPPLYPYLLAFSSAAFGPTRFATAVVQALLAALNIVVVYALAHTLFRRRAVGLLAALLFAASFELVAMTRLYYSESLFLLLSSLGFWLLLKWVRAPNPWLMVSAGIVFALTALTRDLMTLFALACVPVWLVLTLAPRWKHAFVKVLCFGIGFGIILVPWVIRNASIEHRLVLIGTSGEYVFAQNNAREEKNVGITPLVQGAVLTRGKKPTINYQKTILREFRNQPPEKRGAYAVERGMAVIRHAPMKWFLLKVAHLRAFFQPVTRNLPYLRLQALPNDMGIFLEYAMAVIFVGILLTSAVGMWTAQDNAPKLLILLYVLFNLASFIVTHYQPRYRLPLVVLLFPYAAYGIVRLVQLLPVSPRLQTKYNVSDQIS